MRLLFGGLLSLSLIAGNVVAGDFYVGAGLGVSQFDGIADTGSSPFLLDSVSEVSINGLRFDSMETAWSVYFGWQAKTWLAIELGHTDLGNSGNDFGASFFSTPFITGDIFGDGFSIPDYAVLGSGPIFPVAYMTVQQLHLGAKFSTQLHDELSAHWYLGVARTTFDVGGSLPLLEAIGPLVFTMIRIPYSEPSSETGINWGFGFDWDFNERVTLDLSWRRHQAGVLDIDKLELGVIAKF